MSSWLIAPAHSVNISTRAGTSTAQFLKLEQGARHAAMGGTYSGYGNDAFTVWGQPAAIAEGAGYQIGLQHSELFLDVTQEYGGFTGALGGRGRWGLTVNTLGVDDLQRTTENAAGQFGGSGGLFGSRDLGVALHYGFRASDDVSLGFAARYIGSEIDNERATGFAGDAGFRWRVRAIEGLTIGGSVTNVGSGLKFLSRRDDLPTSFRAGAAYQFVNYRLLIAADAIKSIDRDWDAGVGGEWRPIEAVKLRVGYRTQGRDTRDGVTAGIGFALGGLELDYAYVPNGLLGDAHRVSAGYVFGGGSAGMNDVHADPMDPVEAEHSMAATAATERRLK
ncbi:MAG: PorV/PorQ family protein [Candidatus Hydrogenedentota bacterium]